MEAENSASILNNQYQYGNNTHSNRNNPVSIHLLLPAATLNNPAQGEFVQLCSTIIAFSTIKDIDGITAGITFVLPHRARRHMGRSLPCHMEGNVLITLGYKTSPKTVQLHRCHQGNTVISRCLMKGRR